MIKVSVLKKNEIGQAQFDGLKWVVVFALLATGVGANYFFNHVPAAILAAGWIVLLCIVLGIAAFTTKGQQAIAFAKEARIELRKVVWPTRQETMQTTMIVIVLVVFVGLILWGLDSLLLWAIGLVTN